MSDFKIAYRVLESTLTSPTSTPVDELAASRNLMGVMRATNISVIGDHIPDLLRLLGLRSVRKAGYAAMCCAFAVEHGIDPAHFARPIVNRLRSVLRSVNRQINHFQLDILSYDVPDDPEAVRSWTFEDDDVIDLCVSHPSGAEGIWSLDVWCLSAIVCLSPNSTLRRELCDSSFVRLLYKAAQAHWEANSFYKLALVLDDEPIIVMHPRSHSAFEFRISGVSSCDQLQILLTESLSEVLQWEYNGQITSIPRPSPSASHTAGSVGSVRLSAQVALPWFLCQWPAILTGAEGVSYYGSPYVIADDASPDQIWSREGVRLVLLGHRQAKSLHRFERDFGLLLPKCRLVRELSPAEYSDLMHSLIKPALRLPREEIS